MFDDKARRIDTRQEAFNLMRIASQRTNRKLITIATEVADLLSVLEKRAVESFDDLDFGVITMDRTGVVIGYNTYQRRRPRERRCQHRRSCCVLEVMAPGSQQDPFANHQRRRRWGLGVRFAGLGGGRRRHTVAVGVDPVTAGPPGLRHAERLFPLGRGQPIVLDPDRGVGEATVPVVGVRKEILAELVAAGEEPRRVAEL